MFARNLLAIFLAVAAVDAFRLLRTPSLTLVSSILRESNHDHHSDDQLKDLLERGYKMGEILKEESFEISGEMRDQLQDAYIHYSEEASHKIEELGNDGKNIADSILRDVKERVPQQLRSKEAAQHEAEALLNEAKTKVADLGQKFKQRGQEAMDRGKSFGEDIANKGKAAGDEIKGSAGHASERGESVRDAAGSALHEGKEAVKDITSDLYKKAKNLFNPEE